MVQGWIQWWTQARIQGKIQGRGQGPILVDGTGLANTKKTFFPVKGENKIASSEVQNLGLFVF